MLQQITARKHNWQELVYYTTSPMVCVNRDGQITEWNHAMQSLSGVDRVDVLEKLLVGEVFGPKGMLTLMASEGNQDPFTELQSTILHALVPKQVGL